MKEAEITIEFNLSEIALSDIFEIEDLLYKAGIHFDTGAGCGFRNWEWDYCLEGPVKVFVEHENDPDNSVIIEFQLNKSKMAKIREVEKRFKDLGIIFDIEIKNKCRYWLLKSLKGPMEIFFKEFKDDNNE